MTAVVTAPPQVRAATRAVYLAFILMGFAGASWAARIPQVRDQLGLTPSRLGLVLLAIAAGSIVSLVLAGQIVAHFGSRRTVTAMAALLGVSLSATAVGYQFGVLPVVIGLFFYGFANGAWDVAMNVQGAIVERRLGKAIMPRFHAGYSVGTVAGALVGAAVVALDLSVTVHLLVAAILVALVVMFAVRTFVPDDATDPKENQPVPIDPAHAAPPASRLGRTLATWREPRTILIGFFVLAFAFTEGAGIDWISVAMIDGYGVDATIGTLAFAAFLAAMTIGRWFGPGWLDRYGRVPVVRALAVVSILGLALFVFGPVPAVAFLGVLLWGLGASLGFPVGMSAAADDPAHAAPRVSVVATIGYCAFLGGPPLVGFLGDHVTVLKALLAVVGLLGIAVALAGSVRPLQKH
ncbi:MFS transporter [Paractinoplanes rishiriensis]|uniref:MFS transporter n=1 Tax=Paractinoplanes rishiriensis TaxID=1050105 RepID=A0A919K2J5_9ACTN|nr:MFS transporter [Actinoplanes rishiriensis]GIE98294.1 MFS transporter [Actinoplanes rishiriensis]